METLKELYAQYGELMVQAEVIQGRINEVKSKIVKAINQPVQAPAPAEVTNAV